ncbi:MAG TPA: glycosyltransferase [Pyrinomonadaceae bacterium]|nr:glycosyltransferase [Pyrinomonadaceae bacterium]
MRLLARGVQFWQDHGARATYRATLRKLRLSVPSLNRRSSNTSPLPYSYACGRIPFKHGAESINAPGFHKRVNWVIPNFHVSSGGMRTIFRAALALEQAGYEVHFYLFGDTHYVSGSEAAEAIRTFYPLKAAAHLGVADMLPAEFCLATSWMTAYPLRDFAACRRKIYYVQDEESLFHPESSGKMLAEETYRFGFECVCAGRWLAQRMRDYGNHAVPFELAYDPEVYFPGTELPQRKRVVFYSRYQTARRGVELGLLALTLLKAKHPDVEVVLFGADEMPFDLPFDYTLAGVLKLQDLPDLYRTATVGLSISLTNYSLVPQEMLACGLPVVEVNHPSLQAAYPTSSPAIRLAHPTPERLADALSEVITLPLDEVQPTRQEAARLVSHLSWQNADRVLLDFLASA